MKSTQKASLFKLVKSFLPILLFVLIYLLSGFYHIALGTPQAFYQLSPNVAIFPAIVLAWLLNTRPTRDKTLQFIDGIRHPDIIAMCIIFLLAGAFGFITQKIGCVDTIVNLALTLLPPHLLTVGLFVIAAFIATSIGSSMGTIATLAPISVGLANQGAFSVEVGMGILVSGAMFGDNLSLISDTTIASVNSQGADPTKKWKVNMQVAGVASCITLCVLLFSSNTHISITPKEYSLSLVLPYILLVTLAFRGVNVFVALVVSILSTGVIGIAFHGYSLIDLSKDMATGLEGMYDMMVLSMLIGGLSGLTNEHTHEFSEILSCVLPKKSGKKSASLFIATTVALFDILLANNTIAILLSGKIAHDLSKRYSLPSHESAAWLDIFSCVFQGLLPYGAQVLLASSVASVSPMAIIGHVYYCYILGLVSLLFILFRDRLFQSSQTHHDKAPH